MTGRFGKVVVKRRKIYYAALILMIGAFAVSTILHYFLLSRNSDQEQSYHMLVAERVHDAIESRLQGPILVTLAMAQDTFLKECLQGEQNNPKNEVADSIREYLDGIQKSGQYSAAFLISDESKRYYTFKGLNKTINPTGDAYDVWYPIFIDSGNDYSLDVNVDQANQNEWTVFVNGRMEDDAGKLLGTCGVGIPMSQLQELFQSYEEQYHIKINVVDSEGLVQMDSQTINIETTYLMDQELTSSEDYIYTRRGDSGYVVTKYISEFDLYLVVQDDGTQMWSWFEPDYLIWNLAICVVFLIFGMTVLYTVDRKAKARKKITSMTDALTGLPNRDYFKDAYGERGVFNTTRYKAIAVFDIDFFKEANDELDGDEVLKDVVNCALAVMGEKAQIFRWGGDEFAALMEWPVDASYELCRQFCRNVEQEGQVTVSVGVTEVRLSDTIKKNYYRAAQGCYVVKEMGGNGVKRN